MTSRPTTTSSAAEQVRGGGPLLALAVAASFLGSLLLFAFEPYVGKLLLPSFGGTPLLWNTCMVFFQVALLAGYLYALALTRVFDSRRQLVLHLGVLATLFVAYPLAGTHLENVTSAPLSVLLQWLLANALLPFLGLAALTTLVQTWFSRSGHPHAANPYRLYAASNAGSMFGLFAYPLGFEPNLTLDAQRWLFLALLALLVGVLAWFGSALGSSQRAGANSAESDQDLAPLDSARIIALTAAPASLLLGVTNYILTDIASIPFFWTIPLAIYLLTFILAFGRRLYPLPNLFARITTLSLLVVVVTLCVEANSPAEFLIPLHLFVFFAASLFCHVRTASLQPSPSKLPQYYLAISIGGALGGMATLLLPPLLTDGFVEYPLALTLASLAIVPGEPGKRSRAAIALDVVMPFLLLVAGSHLVATFLHGNQFGPGLLYVPAAFYTLSANTRGRLFATRLAVIVATSLIIPSPMGRTLFAERNFFGRVRVTIDPSGEFHRVVHGSTIHGMQRISGMKECHPASYYHPSGPAGQYFRAIPPSAPPMRVALVGLGSGALTCYARPGERWDLFELNPAMAWVASEPLLFSFVTNSKASQKEIVLGDARLSLERQPDARYDIIVVDAFSSDAIPLHLVTREAIASYAAHLTGHGVMLFHISNRFFRLQPVLATVGELAGFRGLVWEDLVLTDEAEADGKSASTWMILARSGEAQSLPDNWEPVAARTVRAWTDEYSNPLGTMQWSSRG